MMWVVFALPFEARGFRLRNQLQKPIRVVTLGACGNKAVDAFERALIQSRQKPDRVLLAGLAGGLDPSLRTGDIVWSGQALGGLQEKMSSNEINIRKGRIHTAPRLVESAAAKESLRSKVGADCVDMETDLLEAVCRRECIPLTAVRSVSDRCCDDLPMPANILINPNTLQPSICRLAAHLAGNPSQLLGFYSMVRAATHARRCLHRALDCTLN
jgi:nucleoside phosphorylase